jgi:hypothetical protein
VAYDELRNHQHVYDFGSDNFSLGVLVFKLVTGFYPFTQDKQTLLRDYNIEPNYSVIQHKGTRLFCKALLNIDGKMRSNLGDIAIYAF